MYEMDLVRVAGGIVWRNGPGEPRLAAVHRTVHDDWCLPRGRLDEREAWRSAALREVAEETGCSARITGFAGAKLFVDRETPKLVLYWHMRLVREGTPDDEDEVDEVAWLTPREALARLDQGSDRRLLMRALADVRRRGGLPPRERHAAGVDADALRRLVVVDEETSAEELAPYLAVIARALDADRRRRARDADLARPRAFVRP